MIGTVIFRYSPIFGWQIFDWVPSKNAHIETGCMVIRDAKDKASLLRLDGYFIKQPKRGLFCKQPHKLIIWPAQQLQRMAA